MTSFRLLLLAVLSFCGSAQTLPTIRFYDLAHLSPDDLRSAMSTMAGIFRRSGVHLEMLLGSPDEFDAHAIDFSACTGVPRYVDPIPLRLRVIAKAPSGFKPNALGVALPCARYGVSATIFADRVLSVSHNLKVPFSTALGHALAHELGHLLLRSDEHTPSGIMRATWSSRDWSNVVASRLDFDAHQSAALRDRR